MRLVSGNPRNRVLGMNGTSKVMPSRDPKPADIGEVVEQSKLRKQFPDPHGVYSVDELYEAAGIKY